MTDKIEQILDIIKVLLTKAKEKYKTQANKYWSYILWYKINNQI